MRILGIETSCDETAAAVVENGEKILSNIVVSSSKIHVKTGGVVPEQAARQQLTSIIPVINEALTQAFGKKPIIKYFEKEIDAIAVTVGPGLVGSLLVGVETAKTLALLSRKPIIPVNHLVAHIYANWVEIKPKFPLIALVVSGGHTDLVLIKDRGKLNRIGGTRDDAAGEAFDKTARLLGLPYPGGPSISKEAEKYFKKIGTSNIKKLNLFPRPLTNEKNFDFSFSGLKTAVYNYLKERKLNQNDVEYLAAEIQEAIVDSLIKKCIMAIRKFKPKSFLLAGGVSANKRLREKFLNLIKTEKLQVFHVPTANLCTDNAVIVSVCSFYNYKPKNYSEISVKPDLTITAEI